MTIHFDDFDVFAAHLMTIVALEGQTMKAQRKIAGMLRDSASPSVASPPLGSGRSKNPRQVHESLTGEDFKKERA